MLLGRATPEATARYAARHGAWKHTGFYRETPLGTISSLGIGTYLGEMTEETDTSYRDAIIQAVRGGINFIDTSLNYQPSAIGTGDRPGDSSLIGLAEAARPG